jgi:DNA excision repair protein ERCC-4
MKGHADLRYENLVAVIDTRDQLPLDLSPLRTVRGTLTTGDYSIVGLEHLVAVERKSLNDLLMCVGRERERFERCVQRLLAYPNRAIVIEASWSSIDLGQWRGDIKPKVVRGSLTGWMARGIPVILSGTAEQAGRDVAHFLFLSARHRWRELQSFYESLRLVPVCRTATKHEEGA